MLGDGRQPTLAVSEDSRKRVVLVALDVGRQHGNVLSIMCWDRLLGPTHLAARENMLYVA